MTGSTTDKRVNKIHWLRRELKSLRRRFKQSSEEKLAELHNMLCKQFMNEESGVAVEDEERRLIWGGREKCPADLL